jgi:hypothetical protein
MKQAELPGFPHIRQRVMVKFGNQVQEEEASAARERPRRSHYWRKRVDEARGAHGAGRRTSCVRVPGSLLVGSDGEPPKEGRRVKKGDQTG